ncbi:hypothetical protein IF1G_08123 [Cordyceps javanica]|uniref:Uncharacterized protein n=1 Tax=Cordyceps javanica TaxID=43265 RepID=A0A545UVQ1_9HYPO|nr:hypothetical protein IF1G_08123 [Cordyceps javanica]
MEMYQSQRPSSLAPHGRVLSVIGWKPGIRPPKQNIDKSLESAQCSTLEYTPCSLLNLGGDLVYAVDVHSLDIYRKIQPCALAWFHTIKHQGAMQVPTVGYPLSGPHDRSV